MTEAVEPEKYSHEQAKAIGGKLCVLLFGMLDRHLDYFEARPERFETWMKALSAHLDVGENENYFDAVVVLDRFLMEAFVLDQPIFPRHVIQEFSDVRQGR